MYGMEEKILSDDKLSFFRHCEKAALRLASIRKIWGFYLAGWS